MTKSQKAVLTAERRVRPNGWPIPAAMVLTDVRHHLISMSIFGGLKNRKASAVTRKNGLVYKSCSWSQLVETHSPLSAETRGLSWETLRRL